MLPLLNASGHICKIKNTIRKNKTNTMQTVVYGGGGRASSLPTLNPPQANI